MKYLPIGYSTFARIIEDKSLYIDKTQYLYKLIKTKKKMYFLSRPRRFGRSLLLTTLYEVFKGNKELFKGLYIYNTGYSWEAYPVIRLSLVGGYHREKDSINHLMDYCIDSISEKHNLIIDKEKDYKIKFTMLVKKLKEKYKKPVVILIDEYDKPILDTIEDIELAKYQRDELKSFYNSIKELEEDLRFVLFTGVSTFSKTYIFSEFSELKDISMDPTYSAILGITQEELLPYLGEYIDKLHKDTIDILPDKERFLKEIKKWYNGYCFSRDCTKVYNSFSLFLSFHQGMFFNFWFETGTPTSLVKLVKKNPEFDLSIVKNLWVKKERLLGNGIENLDLVSYLYQTGYLTIKEYDPEKDLYRLYYPNYEVEISATKILFGDKNQRGKREEDGKWVIE